MIHCLAKVIIINRLNIVLYQPEIPQNTGNISRTCAATGASLHLIKPLGFSIEDKYLKRAGLDYWHLLDLHIYEDIEEFYSKNSGQFVYTSTKAGTIHSDMKYSGSVYLFFGPETRGLPEDIISANIDSSIRLPMISDARSLNLSNTVAVCAYEVLRQWNYEGLLTHGKLSK